MKGVPQRRAPLHRLAGVHHRQAAGWPAAGVALLARAEYGYRLHRTANQSSVSGLRCGKRLSTCSNTSQALMLQAEGLKFTPQRLLTQ